MPTAISGGSRILTNTPAENALNSLQAANTNIALRQLRLSTGKRINSAADDVAGYITARALASRNGALKEALKATGEAKNVTGIAQDALDDINTNLTKIKDYAAQASVGSLGTDEKVALAKSAYRLTQQIQFAVDSTIFGGKELLNGSFTGSWIMGYKADNTALTISVDLTTSNADYAVASNNFNLNATSATDFGGVSGLNLSDLNSVSLTNLGVFSKDNISTTLNSLASALNNVNKAAAYVGGIQNRLDSSEVLLNSQIINYKAAISRIQDANVAEEQLELIKAQFLQQTSTISLAQANQNSQTLLQLFR